jgi:hypothetical protein
LPSYAGCCRRRRGWARPARTSSAGRRRGCGPSCGPYLDRKALDGANRLKLPSDPKRLAGLVSDAELASLAAALVRVALDAKLARELVE